MFLTLQPVFPKNLRFFFPLLKRGGKKRISHFSSAPGWRVVSVLCKCVVGRPEPCTSACLSCLQLHTMGLHCTTAELMSPCPRHTQPYSQLCRLFPICEEKTHYGQMNSISVWRDCLLFLCHFILCNVILASAEGALLRPLWQLMLGVGFLGQSRNLFSNRDDSSSRKK